MPLLAHASSHLSRRSRRARARTAVGLVSTLVVSLALAAVAAPAQSAPTVNHDRIVSAVPGTTPAVNNGEVDAIAQVGGTMVVGGTFTTVTPVGGAATTRSYAMAFDVATGRLVTGFAPALNGIVNEVIPGADRRHGLPRRGLHHRQRRGARATSPWSAPRPARSSSGFRRPRPTGWSTRWCSAATGCTSAATSPPPAASPTSAWPRSTPRRVRSTPTPATRWPSATTTPARAPRARSASATSTSTRRAPGWSRSATSSGSTACPATRSCCSRSERRPPR